MFQTLFGDPNEKTIREYSRLISEINKLEVNLKSLNDSELQNQTNIFIQRLAVGESFDNILPEAFAVVREASWRVLGLRHFDVQLMGGACRSSGGVGQ